MSAVARSEQPPGRRRWRSEEERRSRAVLALLDGRGAGCRPDATRGGCDASARQLDGDSSDERLARPAGTESHPNTEATSTKLVASDCRSKTWIRSSANQRMVRPESLRRRWKHSRAEPEAVGRPPHDRDRPLSADLPCTAKLRARGANTFAELEHPAPYDRDRERHPGRKRQQFLEVLPRLGRHCPDLHSTALAPGSMELVG